MTKNLNLYIFSTKTWRDKGYLKIGQSIDVNQRMRAYKTSTPEEPIVYAELPLTGMSDRDIHQELKNRGFASGGKGGGNEWFKCDVDDVRRVYNYLTRNVSRARNFKLRKEQERAVEKARKWFMYKYSDSVYREATHKNRFLLSAKMRFGKCITGIRIAESLKAKKVLIITYKPEVFQGWMEILNDHIDFPRWSGIRAKKERNYHEEYLAQDGTIPSVTGPFAVCVSLQDLSLNNEKSIKKRLSKVVETKWDLIIFDEVHFGGLTSRVEETLKKLKYNRRLDLSGTPFRLLAHEDFHEKQIFTYTYLDEQRNKNRERENSGSENIYRAFPDLNFATIEIEEDDIKSQIDLYYNKDIDFSLNKLFESSSGKFKNEEDVDSFIEGLTKKGLKARSISVYGALAQKYNLPNKRHSIWWINSVATAQAFAKKLRKHDFFKNFEIINASGCDKRTLEDDEEGRGIVISRELSSITAAINRSNNNENSKGSITLTVKRFLTGVTVKEWDSILVLNDTESPEEYYQAVFRVQSPWVDDSKNIKKLFSVVFDFSIGRCLVMKNSIIGSINGTTNGNGDNIANEVCKSFSLKKYLGGSLEANDIFAQDVFEVMNTGYAKMRLARRITSEAIIRKISIDVLRNNPDIKRILSDIKGYRKQNINSRIILLEYGKSIKKGRQQRKRGKESKELIKKRQEVIKAAEQLIKLSISMTDFIYMTKKRENCIGDVVSTDKGHFFKIVTGISITDFKKLCDIQFIKKEKLNEIVRDFRDQENLSIKTEDFISREILRLAA